MLHAMAKWLAVVVIALACGNAFADAVPPTPASGSGTPETETVPRSETVQASDGDYPKIYLVTMGIGSLIWERHGHIALCVEYGDHQEPVCYNYGIGDFHDPLKMVWGFFRGANSFWAGKDTWRNMMWVYYQFDRTIWKQLLPLDADQKQKIIVKLEHDVLEENRYYAYDHFDDNCTTRIRNIIDGVTGGALSSMTDKTDGRTYRDYARDGFAGMRIPLIGTDIAMGRTTDRVPSYYERMFLPQYLREAVAEKFGVKPVAVYVRKECAANYREAKAAGRPPDEDCIERGIPTVPDPPSGRVILALCLLAATLPVWLTRLWGRLQRTGVVISVAPYVLLGSIFLFLAIISPLPYVEWNESYLVWLPLDAVVLFLSGERQRRYAKGRLIMIGLMFVLMLVHVLKQPLWPEMMWPLSAMLAIFVLPKRDRS
jgi:hypothetical protein